MKRDIRKCNHFSVQLQFESAKMHPSSPEANMQTDQVDVFHLKYTYAQIPANVR